ncbi:MAG: CBS domain-containing protein [Patescibacteria group bacterium]|nr:CBS domain-containing protein [Patescibacteria group bacterium]
MEIQNFVSRKFCSGPEDTAVYDILKQWIHKKTNFFLVTGYESEIIGVVTLYDVLKRLLPFFLQLDDILAEFVTDDLLSPAKIKECLRLTAGEIMTKEVVSIKPEDNFLKAATIIFSMDYDFLPVIDDKGKCHGIVSRTSLEEAMLETVDTHLD